MSKRQKGRKHRTVNRTPRPRGPHRSGRVIAPPAQTAQAAAAAQAAEAAPAAQTARAASEAHAVPAQPTAPAAPATGGRERSGPPGSRTAGDEQYAPVFTSPARDGGLGRTAARTWEALVQCGAEGSTAEELSGSAGYTPATVRKHLTGLARYGLAEQRGDRWFRTGRSQWDAVSEDRSPAVAAAR